MATPTGERTTRSTRYNAVKVAGLAGVLGSALGVAGGSVDRMSDFPGTGSTAADITAFVHAHRSALLVAMVLNTPDASDSRLLYDVAFGLLAMSGAPTALALGSYAALVLRAGRLPWWTALVAAVAALAHLVLLASFLVTGGFFSLEGAVIIAIPATLFAWITGTGIAMATADRPEALIDSPV